MNKGGLRVHPKNFQKTRLQMLQSEIFWSFICGFFFLFFFDSGATLFFPELFAAMPRTSMCLKKWGTERSEVSNGRGVQAPGVLPWKFKKTTTLRIVQSELFWSFTCE